MLDKEVYRKLGFLVGHVESWEGLLAYVDAVEKETQDTLSTASDMDIIYRAQGKLRLLLELKNLKVTMKTELRN